MSLSRAQVTLLTVASAFFLLQLLSHHVTQLLNNRIGFLYTLVAAYVVVFTFLAFVVTLLLWIVIRRPAWKRRSRDWCLTFALILATAVGITLCSTAYARSLPTGSFAKQFDREVWADPSSAEHVPGDITDRQKMLGDAIRKFVAGGTRESILEYLGPSEGTAYSSSSGRELIYRTGPQRDSLFAIDSESLLIWFDAEGRTERYEIWSD